VRCGVQILQTNFRPGIDDAVAPEEDAYGEFYRVRYTSPGKATFSRGGGYHDSLAEAVRAVESMVRDIRWET
jgi:hypothetical protein